MVGGLGVGFGLSNVRFGFYGKCDGIFGSSLEALHWKDIKLSTWSSAADRTKNKQQTRNLTGKKHTEDIILNHK